MTVGRRLKAKSHLLVSPRQPTLLSLRTVKQHRTWNRYPEGPPLSQPFLAALAG